MRLLSVLLLAASLWTPVRTSEADPAPQIATLAVPFLPQTEALCGGAAAAMIFRFWGDRHADVQQFAPLVDRQAGGIADDVLIGAVEARGWTAERLEGRVETLKTQLGAGRPVMVLIEDRPTRYHFVVVVAADDRQVLVHDPVWGPARPYGIDKFLDVWKPSGYWTLLITPGEVRPDGEFRTVADMPAPVTSACDRAMDDAVAQVSSRGLDSADAVLGAVREQCPGSSRPFSELAGVRLAQKRYAEAATLSRQAVGLDRSDDYAWDVLGSSRFVQDDVPGALRAWNAIGRPMLDSVSIEGLSRTRYALVAQLLPFEPNTLLTADAFELAGRRLRDQPTFVSSRIGLRPGDDNWAVADVSVVERQPGADGWLEWTVVGVKTAVNRDIAIDVPGWTGQGEVWSAGWRWWQNRPAITFGFAAPMAGRLGGVWKIDASWAAQQYATAPTLQPVREARLHGAVSRADWASPNLRYELTTGIDVWDESRRAVSVGFRLDRRFASDRVSLAGAVQQWWGLSGDSGLSAVEARASVRSSAQERGFVAAVTVGADAVTASAPFSQWPGAGDVDLRSPVLRAHPLTHHGVIDGDAFGQRLVSASVEQRRWLAKPAVVGVGFAAFVDAAQAWHLLDGSSRGPFIVDAGLGLRLRWPGQSSFVLRVDYGHSLRDGSQAVTVGWVR